jgi:HEAT repeat protein
VREHELVQQLAFKERRNDAIVTLVGGLTATELRQVRIPDVVLDALTRGLADPKAPIRWWCVQLLDHVADVRAIDAISLALDDLVPRVRRNAAHALGCVACKPGWDGQLAPAVVTKLRDMAVNDENATVRAQAEITLRSFAL